MNGITKWITGIDMINNQNCYIINFGWSEELSFPQLIVNPDIDNIFKVTEIVRTSAPSNCFIVFIGGKYVDRVKEIVQKVDSLSLVLQTKPTIYFTEKKGMSSKTPKSLNVFLVSKENKMGILMTNHMLRYKYHQNRKMK